MPTPHFLALVAKADAFFARVVARHGQEMSCDTGCSDCCHVRLTVTAVEAAAIDEHLATLGDEARAALADRATRGDPTRCAALDADGRCGIYAARPLVCRTHGVPVRLLVAGRRLPVVQSCPRNFREHAAAKELGADPDCVLDQATSSTLLSAVDGEYARVAGAAAARVPLEELLTRGR